jgi:NADH dehydrogenase
VVGGGFAGIEAARTLARSGRTDVLLVDVVNFSLFTPMLPEAATGDIETRHILVPHRDVLPPSSFRQGRLLSIDFERGTAVVETRIMPRRDEIRFDHVFFAPGAVTRFYGVEGARERSFTLKTIGDAITIRNRVLALLERASVEGSREGRERLCRVVVVGAGYSGVELTASLADFFRRSCRQYPELAQVLRISLIEARDQVAPMLPEKLRRACRDRLTRTGVELRLGTSVDRVTDDGVHLAGGEFLPSLTVVWTAGVTPSPDLERWGLPLDARGRVRVDAALRVDGLPMAWAAGDAAAVPSVGGGVAPANAQHALRQGKHAAKNILAVLEGKTPKPYTYRMMGELVSLGHRNGAGVILGIQVRGFIGWWCWRTYYLFRLPTWLRRVRVALDWTVDLLFQKDIAEVPLGLGLDRPAAGVTPAGGESPPPPAPGPGR